MLKCIDTKSECLSIFLPLSYSDSYGNETPTLASYRTSKLNQTEAEKCIRSSSVWCHTSTSSWHSSLVIYRLFWFTCLVPACLVKSHRSKSVASTSQQRSKAKLTPLRPDCTSAGWLTPPAPEQKTTRRTMSRFYQTFLTNKCFTRNGVRERICFECGWNEPSLVLSWFSAVSQPLTMRQKQEEEVTARLVFSGCCGLGTTRCKEI